MHFSFNHTSHSFSKTYGIPLAVLLALCVDWLPLPGLEPLGQRTLAFFVFIFLLYLTEALPLTVSSLLVVPLASLLRLAPLKELVAPFGSPVIFLLLGGFFLAQAMLESGLAKRLAFLVLLHMGSSTHRLILSIVFTNILLAFLIPSTTARVSILLPPCLSILELYKESPNSRFAANLLLTLATTCSTISAGILPATITNPVINEYLPQFSLPSYSYLEWLQLGFFPALLLTLCSWFLIQKLYPPETDSLPGGKEFLRQELRTMGPMDVRQKKVLGVFLVTIFFWMTGEWFHLDTTTVCLAGAMLLLLPKVEVLDWRTVISHLNYNVLFIAGGGLSLGNLLLKNGTAAWLANCIFSQLSLQQLSPVVFLACLLFFCQFLHVFFVGTTVMCTTLLPIILTLSQAAGFPARATAFAACMVISGYPVLLFYCTTSSILVYGTGKVPFSAFPRTGLPISLLVCLVYTLWSLIIF